MLRISVADVRQAYQQTGLRPVSNVYGDGINCGCPLTALAVRAGLRPFVSRPFSVTVTRFADSEYGEHYAIGFADGFDSQPSCRNSGARYDQGYADGAMARVVLS